MGSETTTKIKAVVHGSTSDQVAGEIQIRQLSARQKALQALKVLGISWGIGVIAVAIPILHFILVPFFLLVGPVAATWMYRQGSRVLKGSIPCPKCRSAIEIVEGFNRWPKHTACLHCKSAITLDIL